MEKKFVLVALALMLVTVSSVKAGGTGTIRIDPYWPAMQGPSADFEIWVTSSDVYEPNVLLVMTEGCYNGLTDNVVVSWSHDGGGSVSFGPFAGADYSFTGVTTNSEHVPPTGTTEGARYTVASLKDHLSYDLSVPLSSTDTIYWAMGPFVVSPLTGTPQQFHVELKSASPRMLIYALGKTDANNPKFDDYLNAKVPPTRPGFVVPEPATILLALASFSAFALYAIRRRKALP